MCMCLSHIHNNWNKTCFFTTKNPSLLGNASLSNDHVMIINETNYIILEDNNNNSDNLLLKFNNIINFTGKFSYCTMLKIMQICIMLRVHYILYLFYYPSALLHELWSQSSCILFFKMTLFFILLMIFNNNIHISAHYYYRLQCRIDITGHY